MSPEETINEEASARLKALFEQAAQPTDKTKGGATKESPLARRRRRETRAKRYGDGRVRYWASPNLVQMNMKVPGEFKDKVLTMAKERNIAMVDIVVQGVLLLSEHEGR